MKAGLFALVVGLLTVVSTTASAVENRPAMRHARQAARAAGIVQNQLERKLPRGHFAATEAEIVEAMADSLKDDFRDGAPLEVVHSKFQVMVEHAEVLMNFLATASIDRDRRIQNQARLMLDDIATIGELLGAPPGRDVVVDGGR